MPKSDKLGIVFVTYGEGKDIYKILDVVAKEKRPGDMVSLIDNHPDHATAKAAQKHPAVDVVIRSPQNSGYVGNNIAAKEIEDKVDLLLFLNPDSRPEPGAITKLREGGLDEWMGWMGLLLLPDGKINSAGNSVHISGLSWVNDYGESANMYIQPTEVDIMSGADLLIRTPVWKKIGGFASIYFIYYEDTEISSTAKAMGYKIGLVPSARIGHNYSFYNSPRKWFLIERNRYIYILRNWPWGVILVLFPILALTEIGLWAVSILQKRFRLKFKSTLSLFRLLPQTLKSRRRVQKLRQISTLEYFDMLVARIDTPLLPKILSSAPVNWVFVGYYKIARFILSLFSAAA
jgi:GT2 family glycosyltransferase